MEQEQEQFIKRLPQAEVMDLRKIITVEQEQVSSLTLVQRQNLAMTLISVDTGSSIGGHSSPGDAMVNILSGEARITIDDKPYSVRAGETLILPANIPHALYATEAFQMLLIVVKPEKKGLRHVEKGSRS
ncbi:cupin domain-containing protein [Paenibacillus sp. FSL R7-0337]|uniref:cupin domain-containing protein n=1 Tax=unclassified Paenibacillus TaxID=185978 RepID=UPI00096ECC15|nr:cupin domain-containing protein [Paenibacillus sp. FSL R7-0337]OMG01260.1 cupin [Paenibacillus sp. FSL R7-0337]